ncbi:hypothetical protein ACLOJK_016041 [Asimina triloba]
MNAPDGYLNDPNSGGSLRAEHTPKQRRVNFCFQRKKIHDPSPSFLFFSKRNQWVIHPFSVSSSAPQMAIAAAAVVVPLGIMFIFSGLIVNLIQVFLLFFLSFTNS